MWSSQKEMDWRDSFLVPVFLFVFQSFPISNRAELSARWSWKSCPRLSWLSQIDQGIIGNIEKSFLVFTSINLCCFPWSYCPREGVRRVGEGGGKKKNEKKVSFHLVAGKRVANNRKIF